MELKKRMTYEEMAEYFEFETGKLATKSGSRFTPLTSTARNCFSM